MAKPAPDARKDDAPYFQVNYRPTKRVQISFEGEVSRTKQSFRDECNVNNIMAKFEKTGLLDHLNVHQGDYGNFIGYDDYHTSLNQIHAAEDAFMTIPAVVRAKFNNDASQFLRFAQDPENLDQMVEMGLANPKAPSGSPKPDKASKAPEDPSEPPLPLTDA